MRPVNLLSGVPSHAGCAVIFCLALLSGCDSSDLKNQLAAEQKDAPFEGVWRVGYPREPATFYIIDVEGSKGSIIVEVDGETRQTHRFEYGGGNEISFPDGVPQVEETGPAFSYDLYKSRLYLDQLPAIMTFKETDQVPFYSNSGDMTFALEGIVSHSNLLLHEVEEDDRIGLPFKEISWDGDIYSPQGTYKPPSQEPLAYTAKHLNDISDKYSYEGEIKTLKIAGREIALKSSKLRDGMLSTQDFGKLEVRLEGITIQDIVFRGTREQIRKMRNALPKEKKEE